MSDTDGVRILWTGGWDSTFRVIQLARLGATIRPYYLLTPDRDSHRYELAAIAELKRAIQDRYPGCVIHPPQLGECPPIGSDPELHAAQRRLQAINDLGRQYELIATYAKQNEVRDLELCIHRDDKAFRFIAGRAEVFSTPYGMNVRLAGADDDVRALFGRLLFPVLQYTKLEMKKDAARESFLDILERTWFCHTPTPEGAPCGLCNPCMFTIEEGLGARIPWKGKLRYATRRAMARAANPVPRSVKQAGKSVLLACGAPGARVATWMGRRIRSHR